MTICTDPNESFPPILIMLTTKKSQLHIVQTCPSNSQSNKPINSQEFRRPDLWTAHLRFWWVQPSPPKPNALMSLLIVFLLLHFQSQTKGDRGSIGRAKLSLFLIERITQFSCIMYSCYFDLFLHMEILHGKSYQSYKYQQTKISQYAVVKTR